jgi:hypothetical protein
MGAAQHSTLNTHPLPYRRRGCHRNQGDDLSEALPGRTQGDGTFPGFFRAGQAMGFCHAQMPSPGQRSIILDLTNTHGDCIIIFNYDNDLPEY